MNGKTGDELSRNGRSDLDGPAGRVAGAVQFTRQDKGVRSFPVTLKTSGTQKVTVTNEASSPITGSQTVTVPAGPAKTFELSSLAGCDGGYGAGRHAHRPRAFNNVATGYRGTVQLTSSDPQAVLPANHTFTAGDAGSHTFSVRLKTAGSQTVTLIDTRDSDADRHLDAGRGPPASASSLTLAGLGNAVAGTTQSVSHRP